MEGLGLVEAEAVEGAHLVRVGVLLGGPAGSVPVLPVGRVAAGQLVRGLVANALHLRVVELHRVVPVAPVGAAVGRGRKVACARGGGEVVHGLVVGGSAQHGLRAVAARVGVQLFVDAGDAPVVESGGGEGVLGLVEGLLVEDFARLLGERLAQMVVVDLEARDVALVAGEDSGLASDGGLLRLGWGEMGVTLEDMSLEEVR